MKILAYLFGTAILLTLTACTTITHSNTPQLQHPSRWSVAPFTNHTETPMAGQRARSISQVLLAADNHIIVPYVSTTVQPKKNYNFLSKLQSPSLSVLGDWGKKHKVHYILTGTVNEWRYKVGLDGVPVVGITLRVLDTKSGEIIWRATGSESGGSNSALSAVGQDLISDMLSSL